MMVGVKALPGERSQPSCAEALQKDFKNSFSSKDPFFPPRVQWFIMIQMMKEGLAILE